MRLERWAITGWTALGLALVVAVTLAAFGWTEEGVRSVVRSSAKIGVVLFSLAFGASSLRRLWRSAASAWLLRNRRYIGVSFAIAHFLHLAALVALGISFPEPFVPGLDALTLVGGGSAYVLLAGMTLTSFDRTAAWLGRRAWTRLHTVGSYVLWGIFLQSYLPRVFVDSPLYAPFPLLLIAVFALRMWVRFSLPERRPGARAEAGAG